MVDTAALERIVEIARAVRGDNHDWAVLCAQGAQFGDADLKIGEQFEQKALELFVGAIQLVDQQHWRGGMGLVDRLEQRALEQKRLGIEVRGRRGVARGRPARLKLKQL